MPAIYLKPSYLAILVGITFLIGCKPAQKNLATDSINQIASDTLGESFESHSSPNGAYILFIEKLSPTAANPIIKFIVIDSVSQKVLIEKSFRPGYAKWIGDSVIEFFDAPGIVKQNEDLSSYVKKIDVTSYKN
jgi:hypothetical protein